MSYNVIQLESTLALHGGRGRCIAHAHGGRFALVSALGATVLMLGGCYEHVTQAGFTSTEVRETHEPNVEEEGPSWLNEFMWGEPPKGENAMRYYRRKNTLGLDQ